MRILVVDDEPLVAGLIADGLRDEGYEEIVIANSGPEGLQDIERDPPDVVFLDITMPGMDGIEVLRRIRERWADLPVIILSGWGTEQQIEAARKLGVTDVLQKPAPLKNLSQTLARLQRVAGTAPPYVIVVARNQPRVFEYLGRKFAGDLGPTFCAFRGSRSSGGARPPSRARGEQDRAAPPDPRGGGRRDGPGRGGHDAPDGRS